MSELTEGFTMDLSKTFDLDEDFNKVAHSCGPTREVHYMPLGEQCPRCGEIVRK